jgi:diguanylate cyclase (GGDEF)-like protein/PAS domain S-box-containing protein
MPKTAACHILSAFGRENAMDVDASKSDDGTVLIIDDDFTTRLLARETLEQAGFAIEEIADGRDALEGFDRINPDVILLDVLMPGMDGFTVCRQIREHPEGWNTPILMMTGLDDTDSIKKAYETGATDFVAKPCNWLVLGYRVRYMLRASQMVRALSRSWASLNHAQHLAQIGSWEWEVKNDILHWSEAVYRIFAIDPIGFDRSYHSFLNSVHPLDRESVHSAFNEAMANNKKFSIDHQIITPDGTTRYVHTEAKVVNDRTGRPIQVTGTVQDITERKLYEEQIRKLAYYDSLTGLPNRVLFKENLARSLARAEHDKLRVATLFLDMDHFKEINDTLGHDVGDKLLQDFADRLTYCVRKTGRGFEAGADQSNCPVARLGGDEFTVILDEIARIEDVGKVALRIVDTMATPFDLDGRQVSVTVSIGISIYPDDGSDIVTLLKCADIAMYQAKNQGRNKFNFYSRLLFASGDLLKESR